MKVGPRIPQPKPTRYGHPYTLKQFLVRLCAVLVGGFAFGLIGGAVAHYNRSGVTDSPDLCKPQSTDQASPR
jgi:hypothetical protein